MEMLAGCLFQVALPDGCKLQVVVIPMEKGTVLAKGFDPQK